MIGRQLTQSTLVLGMMACTAETTRPPGTSLSDTRNPDGAAWNAGATGTTSGGAGGDGPDDAGWAGASTGGAQSNDGAGSVDAAPSDGPIMRLDGEPVIQDDAPFGPVLCADNQATLGSNRLLAGGSTPASFAAAYNAELAALHGPGPLLIVLSGVNDAVPARWIASFGPLDASRAGGGVRFAGPRADVGFVLDPARSVRITPTSAQFGLKFMPDANDVTLPAGSIELSGTLGVGCGAMVVARAKLLVPESAGGVAFHGSTIAALMGPATEAYQGQPAAAWPLELAGTAKQVYAPGVLEGDAGR